MADDPTLIRIRERSFLDLLDLALVVIRRRPLTIGLTAALGIAPFALLNYVLITSFGDFFVGFVVLVLIAVEAPFATASLTVVLGGLMFGERPGAKKVGRRLLRSFWPMLLVQGFFRGMLMATVFLSPIDPAQLAFVNEVILLEREGDRERRRGTIGRSSELCGGRSLELVLFAGMQLFFTALFVTSFRWAVQSAISLFFLDETFSGGDRAGADVVGEFFFWLFDVKDPIAQLGLWIAVVFFAVVRFLTYIDQRIRLEGWEVALRLRAVGAAMELEDSDRW